MRLLFRILVDGTDGLSLVFLPNDVFTLDLGPEHGLGPPVDLRNETS
ncbi:hypothetical protein [Streptomyces sp. NPDC047000]